jgi:hypothetical protein
MNYAYPEYSRVERLKRDMIRPYQLHIAFLGGVGALASRESSF